MRKRMRSAFVLVVLMLVPFVCNAEGYQSIETIREQLQTKLCLIVKINMGEIYISILMS